MLPSAAHDATPESNPMRAESLSMTTDGRAPLPRRRFLGRLATGLATLAALSGGGAEAGERILLRVETEVFADDDEAPVARSLTLFQNGIAWDFLEALPKKPDEENAGPDEPAEFVLHDPARERIILVDPARHVRTQIDHLQLERLRASLGSWARKSEDPLMRWAGGPEFGDSLEETATKILLEGPRVRYEVTFEPAGNGAAVLIKALVHPGGIPPFPRIAINRRVAAAGGIPVAVRLEIESRMARLGRRPNVLRSEHKVLESWLTSDHKRVAAAEERLAVAAQVDLATYAGKKDGPEGGIAAGPAATKNR